MMIHLSLFSSADFSFLIIYSFFCFVSFLQLAPAGDCLMATQKGPASSIRNLFSLFSLLRWLGAVNEGRGGREEGLTELNNFKLFKNEKQKN